MADETRSSSTIAILVALLGVIGSVTAAWVTTNAKFSNEFDDKKEEILLLKQDLIVTEKRLEAQLRALDDKLDEVDQRLAKLDAQIELATEVGKSLAAGGAKAAGAAYRWMVGNKKEEAKTEEKDAPPKE